MNTNSRQQHRDARKDSEQNDRQPSRRDRIANYVLECARIRQRQRWIDCLDFALNRWNQSSRILVALHYVDRGEVCALREWDVHLRLGIDIQPEMAHVTDNSYDRDPLRIVRHAPHHDPFAQRILVRPEFLRESLIHEDDGRRICLVSIGKKSAFDQWYLECAK